MIRHKNETEDLLLSITKNCEMLIEQTHRKPEETLEFKMAKPTETFHFKPPVQVKENWMLGLVNLEVYNYIFNITEENNKFEIYRDTVTKFQFLDLKVELEEILGIPHITREHLLDDETASRIINEYHKLSQEKKNSDGYTILLLNYSRSQFRDFENYLRIRVGLDEEDIQLILKENISHFTTYELSPGIYTTQDISDAVHTFSGHSDIIEIEYNDISMKTKIILKYKDLRLNFGLGTLRFDKKSFFHTLSGHDPYFDYKAPGVYTSDKILNLNTTNKIHLKCDCIDSSIQKGVRQPTLFTFVLDKPSGYKIFCEPETIHYKKINKSVLNTITFYLEDDNNKEVDFNQETFTFITNDQNMSNYNCLCYMFLCYKWVFKNLKLILIVLEAGIDLLQ